MRRLVVAGLILLIASACSDASPHAFEGFRDIDPDEVLAYRIEVSQKRTATGLGDPKTLKSKVVLDIEEEPSEQGYTIVVRNATATGESTQITAAKRLKGRRLVVDLEEGAVLGAVELFAGAEDLAAADIGLLNALFAPVLQSPRAEIGEAWRAKTPAIKVPWAQEPLAFTLSHNVIGSGEIRALEVARVKSSALTNVRFRLPLIEQATPGSPGSSGSGGERTFIVNELFENLFAGVDNPVEGAVVAIAAIPLAIAAPFLAIGEAIGSIFGGSSGSKPTGPTIPVVDLAGPIELISNTVIWRADGRVLEATGKGTSELTGTLPELSGGAAELSNKPLTLSTSWSLRRTLTSPWPEPRPIPSRPLILVVLAILAVVAGASSAALFQRRSRRLPMTPVRDTVTRPVRWPETIDA